MVEVESRVTRRQPLQPLPAGVQPRALVTDSLPPTLYLRTVTGDWSVVWPTVSVD